MKGIDKEFDFGVLYHPHYSLDYRRSIFEKYQIQYNVRLYKVVEGFNFPDLIEAAPNDGFQMSANGFVVGNKLKELVQG